MLDSLLMIVILRVMISQELGERRRRVRYDENIETQMKVVGHGWPLSLIFTTNVVRYITNSSLSRLFRLFKTRPLERNFSILSLVWEKKRGQRGHYWRNSDVVTRTGDRLVSLRSVTPSLLLYQRCHIESLQQLWIYDLWPKKGGGGVFFVCSYEI